MDDPKKPSHSSSESDAQSSEPVEEPAAPLGESSPETEVPASDTEESSPEEQEPREYPDEEQYSEEPEDVVLGSDMEESEGDGGESTESEGDETEGDGSPPGGVSQGEPEGVGDSDEEELEPDRDEESRQLGGRMTFLEHLDELRRRILYSAASVMVTFLVGWIFRERIFGTLAIPIRDVVEKLVVIRPTEPFTIYLKVSFVAAVFLAAPFILFQVWMFIAPGLYRREKSFALPFLLSSTTLFILGGLFAYYVVLPPALNFLLLEFGAEFAPMISAVEFFDFELIIILGMGVVFQLPVLVAFLSIFGLVTPRFLWKNFRYAFLIITIVAAVISPTTDPLNLFLWSGPMVILYTLSIGISWIFQRRRQRKERERDEQ